MVASRVPAVIDALTAVLVAANIEGVSIWDGPLVTGEYGDSIFIGYDADPQGGEEQASEVQQDWAGIGAQARNETGQITCAVVVFTGNQITSWKDTRDRAFALLDEVGDAVLVDLRVGWRFLVGQ